MIPVEAQTCGNNRRCLSRVEGQGETHTNPGASAPASTLAQEGQEQMTAPASCETWSALNQADCGSSATKVGEHGRGDCCKTEPPDCNSAIRSCEAHIEVEALEGSGCCKAEQPGYKHAGTEESGEPDVAVTTHEKGGCCRVEQSKDRSAVAICQPKEAGKKVEEGGSCCKVKQPNCKSANIGCKEPDRDDDNAVDDATLCPCCVQYVLENSETAISESSSRLNLWRAYYESHAEVIRRCCFLFFEACCQQKGKTHIEEGCIAKPKDRRKARTSATAREKALAKGHDQIRAGKQAHTGTRIVLNIDGMDCPDCTSLVDLALHKLDGVEIISLNYFTAKLELQSRSAILTSDAIADFMSRSTGFKASIVEVGEGADITNDVRLAILLESVPPIDMVNELGIDFSQKPYLSTKAGREQSRRIPATVPIDFFDGGKARTARAVLSRLEEYGAVLAPPSQDVTEAGIKRNLKATVLRALLLAVLTVPILVLVWGPFAESGRQSRLHAQLILSTLVQFGAWPIYSTSLRVLWYFRRMDLGLLVTISTWLAYLFSVVAYAFLLAGSEFAAPFFETNALLVTLIYIGRVVQVATRKTVYAALSGLQNLRAPVVTLVDQDSASGAADTVSVLDARLLQLNDIMRVSPESRIPTDGIVVAGTSDVDESAMTGESTPASKARGSIVLAGTLNLTGSLDIQATRPIDSNSVSTIAALMQKAQSGRSQLQDKADKVASWLLPIASTVASISCIIWLLINRYLRDRPWGESVAEAVTYLIAVMAASCPCALALAVPLTASATMIASARQGILFKSVDSLTSVGKVDTFAFDKTGTLSTTTLAVKDEYVSSAHASHVTKQLASVTQHPVSKAVASHLKTLQPGIESPELIDVVSVPGQGISARLPSKYEVRGGSPNFTGTQDHPGVKAQLELGYSVFAVTIGSQVVAHFALAVSIRPEAPALLRHLAERGREVYLLSGDHQRAVDDFCRKSGIPPDRAVAGCSPSEKCAFLEELETQGKRVCYVGDGTNDSAALATVAASIAVAKASEVAVAAASVVLLTENIERGIIASGKLAQSFRLYTFAALGWSCAYFVFAGILASGAAVKFRLGPQYAALSELASLVPVLFIAGLAYLVPKHQSQVAGRGQ